MDKALQEQIAECLNMVAAESGLGTPQKWTIREYEHLSELLEEKTKIRISSSTLKRLYKGSGATRPQVSTLNALAMFIGYRDWYDFIRKHDGSTGESPRPMRRRKISSRMVFGLLIILAGIMLYIFWPEEKNPDYPEDVLFEAQTLLEKGVPNTVTFTYNLDGIDYDSACILEKWWYKDLVIPIETGSEKSTKVYYFPGVHNVSLVADGSEIAHTNFQILTEGWMALVYKNFDVIRPSYLENQGEEYGHLLYVTPEQISGKGIDLSEQHIVSYYNFRDFGSLDGDNFKLKARLRSPLGEGGQKCQHAWISLVCEKGDHYVSLVDPACLGLVDIKLSDHWKKAVDEDLSAFGCNLELWHEVELKVSNKLARVRLDGTEIYSAEYTQPVGKVYGIYFQFFGTGSVDFVGLYDDESRPVLVDIAGG